MIAKKENLQRNNRKRVGSGQEIQNAAKKMQENKPQNQMTAKPGTFY